MFIFLLELMVTDHWGAVQGVPPLLSIKNGQMVADQSQL